MSPADSAAASKILVVDDEAQIQRVLRTTLAGLGYSVRTAADGAEALAMLREWVPDLIITDLSMPNLGGLELCRRVRASLQTPIIVLSVRGEEKLKVEALDGGADDYVTKPFNMNELLARVRAGLRRGAPTAHGEHGESETAIDAGDFHIDLERRLVSVGDRQLRLTPKEFELLCYLARNPQKVLTHRSLLSAVWGSISAQQTEYLHVFVNRLRKKLEPADGSRHYIVTEKWVGYRFEPGGSA